MGLFDTVNSVPKFETAWMQRSKFPYTAHSSAKIIRHAVSIDERRAKFRQDLISESKHQDDVKTSHKIHRYGCDLPDMGEEPSPPEGKRQGVTTIATPKPGSKNIALPGTHSDPTTQLGIRASEYDTQLIVPSRSTAPSSSESLVDPDKTPGTENLPTIGDFSKRQTKHFRRTWSTRQRSQDIQEV